MESLETSLVLCKQGVAGSMPVASTRRAGAGTEVRASAGPVDEAGASSAGPVPDLPVSRVVTSARNCGPPIRAEQGAL